MYIQSIKIENYKSFPKLEILCDKNFNFIIGENNIGKSSIFEALLLWKQCYDCSTLSKRDGFYKPASKRYLRYDDIEFLRLTSDIDLYNNIYKNIHISLEINYKDTQYDLGFNIERPKNPSNTYFRILYDDYKEFAAFSKDFDGKISEAIFIYKTQPVSSVPSKEPFMNRGQVLKKISKGKSYEVLRNKIIKSTQTTQNVIENLSQVLEQEVSIKLTTSRSTDEYINLEVAIEKKAKEMHLQGSGFLQIAEIFSSIEYFESALNIVLLDEPDSHIHTKLLNNLIATLSTEIENNQIFIITHNEKFIDHSGNHGNLYFLNSKSKEDFKLLPIDSSAKNYIKEELGNILTSLEEFSSVDKVIFVEGQGDKRFWSELINKYISIENIDNKNLYYIYTDGKDDLKNKVHNFLRMLSQVLNISSVGVIFDKDFSTIEKNKSQITELRKTLKGYEDFICSYEGYCLESTFFLQTDLISRILSELTGIEQNKLEEFISRYLEDFKNDLSKVTSQIYITLKKSFTSQKRNRPDELKSLDFDTVVKDFIENGIHYALTKDQVNNLLSYLIEKFEIDASVILNINTIMKHYLNNITKKEHIYSSHLTVLEKLIR